MDETADKSALPGRTSARRVWLMVHRWLGLTFGLPLVLIGLTGSVLVFDHAIDEWLNPNLLLASGESSSRPLQEIIHAAEESRGESALSVTKPRVANGVWTVWFATGTPDAPTFTAVHVDPPTGRVTGSRVWGEDLLSWIYRLHFRLLAGTPGAIFVGICGLVMMVSVISGLWLWWPLWRHSWRAAFAIRAGSRFNYDLHKSIGIAGALFLPALAFTGVYMEFPELIKPVVTAFSAETTAPRDLASNSGNKTSSITADEAIAIAQKHFPKAKFDHLHPPEGPNGTYEVAFRQAHEVQKTFGRSQVFLDQYSGDVLAVRNPDDFTAADAFLAWQFPLHSGEAFGLAGRWIVFCTGLVPGVLYVTGCLLWWRRRRRRHKIVPRPGRQQNGRSEWAPQAEVPVGSSGRQGVRQAGHSPKRFRA